MDKIPLIGKKGKDKFVLVDEEDFEWLRRQRWYLSNRGYAVRSVDKILMHIILVATPRGFEIDHVNGNRLDNRKSNLRIATASQNRANSKLFKNNTSGLKGVGLHKGRIRAFLNVDKKYKHLGYFESATEAAKAYNKGAIKHFGKFAKLNII